MQAYAYLVPVGGEAAGDGRDDDQGGAGEPGTAETEEGEGKWTEWTEVA